MKLVENRTMISKYFDEKQALNIKGVLQNTKYDAFVDSLDNSKNIWIKDCYFQFLYAENESFVDKFNKEIEYDFFGFSGTNDIVLDYYMKDHLIQWKNTCTQLHYEGEKFHDIIPLDSLKLEDAEYVDKNYEYNNDNSLEKIKDAIRNRPTSCLRVLGKIVSFVLLHEDNSIGYMITLPEFRGKGYAYELTKDIVNKTIDSGRLPYVQIVKGNFKSVDLAKKVGFVEHGDVHWFGIMRIGESVKECCERYIEIYNEDPISISTKVNIELKYDVLDVIISDKKFIYGNQSFCYECQKEDEVYYLYVDEMPESILISGLYKLLSEEYETVIVNQYINHVSFHNFE